MRWVRWTLAESGAAPACSAAHYKHFSTGVQTFSLAPAGSTLRGATFSRTGKSNTRTGPLSHAPAAIFSLLLRFLTGRLSSQRPHRQDYPRTGRLSPAPAQLTRAASHLYRHLSRFTLVKGTLTPSRRTLRVPCRSWSFLFCSDNYRVVGLFP